MKNKTKQQKIDETRFLWFLGTIREKTLEHANDGDDIGFPMTASFLLEDKNIAAIVVPEVQFSMINVFLELAVAMSRCSGFSISSEVWITEGNSSKPDIEPRIDPNRKSGVIQFTQLNDYKKFTGYMFENGKLVEKPAGKLHQSGLTGIYDRAQISGRSFTHRPCKNNHEFEILIKTLSKCMNFTMGKFDETGAPVVLAGVLPDH